MAKATRADALAALDGEREYQDRRWNVNTTTSEGEHELESFFYYAEHYLGLARTALSTKAQQDAYPEALHIARKIGALMVAAMEQHGAPKRQG